MKRPSVDLFHPSQWTVKFYLVTAGFLAAMNLMGPNGFVHWVLLKQEARRLEARSHELQAKIVALQNETQHFRASRVAKERTIREELGYLKADELSVEISP
ncbi:MAG: hypothetical protein JST16_04230 [Bdellovibrionales bacterium]|nr:hypothetical protein [Bdellovibrionales bacterium]